MRLDERKPIRKIVDGKLFCIPCNTKVESQHHFAANHDPRILKCEECGVEKIGKAKMKDHKRLHQSAKCPKCNKAYSNKSSLWTHEQLCIKGKTPQIYVCDQCSYQSTKKCRFKKHKEENLCKAMSLEMQMIQTTSSFKSDAAAALIQKSGHFGSHLFSLER